MKMVKLFAVVAAAFFLPMVASAETSWGMQVIHVEAKDSTVLSPVRGVTLPEVYVLDSKGSVVYAANSDQKLSTEAVVAALKGKDTADAKPNPGVLNLLTKHNVKFGAPRYTLVTVEFGDSVGKCPGCEQFYPVLQSDISNGAPPSFNWVHLKLEKNGYRD